jgi:hypothetical protein
VKLIASLASAVRHPLILALLVLGVLVACCLPNDDVSTVGSGNPLSAGEVSYRYQYLGEEVTHVLRDVTSVTVYRRPEAVDQVVFSLSDGRDYVVNADRLVSYALPDDGSVEQRVAMNKLYHHYDPYLQAEKQRWHHQWVNETYLRWVGRLPTEDEWVAALNELTRGVEHHQMERWIRYSLPARQHLVTTEFGEHLNRSPRESEIFRYTERLRQGDTYDEIRRSIASRAAQER